MVGGWNDWQYVFRPDMLPLPEKANVEHAHGIVIDGEGTIVITYKDALDDSQCLLRWDGDYKSTAKFIGPGRELCVGVPHGLRSSIEEGSMVLYHANNEQSLHKTTMDGDIIWSVLGKPKDNMTEKFSPTWFAAIPAYDDGDNIISSDLLYLADGYGSNKIFIYNRSDGSVLNSHGGPGSENGQFSTCHSISWDSREGQMVVSDRENHRLEYFRVDPSDPSVFEYSHTRSFLPLLQRPCNLRIREEDGAAIVPTLEGAVGILDSDNGLLSFINITDSLGDRGFLHPHDAHFVPGTQGDFVLVTWNPGRIGYFQRLTQDTEEVQ